MEDVVKEPRKETVVKESKLLQTVKQGEVFKTLLDVEDLVKSLEAQHHPLKIFKSESVDSYNKKVGQYYNRGMHFVWGLYVDTTVLVLALASCLVSL